LRPRSKEAGTYIRIRANGKTSLFGVTRHGEDLRGRIATTFSSGPAGSQAHVSPTTGSDRYPSAVSAVAAKTAEC